MFDDDIIDWYKPECNPETLVKMFEERKATPAVEIRPALRTDIDTSVKIYSRDPPNPDDFNLITVSKGKASLDKNMMVRYLKACRIVYDGTTPYIFNGSIYAKIDNGYVERVVYKALESISGAPFISKTTVSDIIAMLRATNTFLDIDPPSEWDMDGHYEGTLIPFQNGLYNLDNDELLPFTPWLFITHQLSAMYRPKIIEHEVSKIYEKILPDPDTRRFFFEMVGFSLFSPTMSPPSIFLIYGPGNTGKTALQEAVATAAGRENMSSLSISQISADFMTAELQGKLINVCGETGPGGQKEARVDGELMKRLSDGQPIMVEHKYGHPYQMCNTAKLWFVSNTMPDFGDTSSGLYRRLYVIPCRVEQNWAEQIYSRMQDHEAISWLVNQALYAYLDFLDNGSKFHVSKEMLDELRSYKKLEATMDFFEQSMGTTDKFVVADRLDGEFVGPLYDSYRYYVSSGGGKPLSIRKFVERVRNEFALETVKVRDIQDNGRPTYRVKFKKP